MIDLVRAYTEAGGPFELPGPGPAIEATRALLEAARAAGHPVVWTSVVYSRGLADGGLFVRKVPALRAFEEGGEGGWGKIGPLKPEPGEAV